MKLIIEIPDEVYNFTIQRGHFPYGVNITGSIIDGEVVPEGHGDLIDRDVAYKEFDKACLSWEGGLLKFIPTVIPRDK